jgi:hypothetical protein
MEKAEILAIKGSNKFRDEVYPAWNKLCISKQHRCCNTLIRTAPSCVFTKWPADHESLAGRNATLPYKQSGASVSYKEQLGRLQTIGKRCETAFKKQETGLDASICCNIRKYGAIVWLIINHLLKESAQCFFAYLHKCFQTYLERPFRIWGYRSPMSEVKHQKGSHFVPASR